MSTGIYKRKLMDITGQRYGKLTAIKFSHKDKRNQQFWLFKCDCGNEKIICIGHVKSGNTKSCGCLRIERKTKHKMYGTRIYKSWMSMKERCLNKNRKDYKDYGGRGIIICERWVNSFENFYKDMGNRIEGLSLDRIDNNKGYYKENCRWATLKEQNNNKRNNHLLTHNRKTQNVKQWSEELNINYGILSSRLTRGWSVKNALEM